jgi:hypothetical protein
MNLTCFYCQTPFTLSMDQKIAALRKMHAENLHHYDAHCPRCGRANAISRERLEMFTPGWEEAIRQPVMAGAAMGGQSAETQRPNTEMPAPVPAGRGEPEMTPPAAQQRRGPARKRHAPASKKAAGKGATKKAPARKTPTKKSAGKTAKKSATRSKSKTASKKTSRKSR